ncbi:MAG: MFS transporter [Gammaproteobacteria bacterium]
MSLREESIQRRGTWRFVVAIGVVSFFADMTYEGARSIVGPYLGSLGASALLVGVIGGGAEFLGYGVRWFSGRGADASGRHWLFMYVGYALNLLAVPFLALTSTLGAATGLVVSERLGKGVRTPPRDALLARAGSLVGQGASFGLHELLDQAGALLGPLIVAALLVLSGYHAAFAVLALPAVAALISLVFAQRVQHFRAVSHTKERGRLPRQFFFWLVFAALATAGLAHFVLISFHLAQIAHLPLALIPVIFAVGMASEGLAAFLLGRLSDRSSPALLVLLPLAAAAGGILLFLLSGVFMWLGVICWGIAMGVQSTLLKAQVARVVPADRHGEAFGLLDTVIGASWFIGSIVLGALYGLTPSALVIGTLVFEALALFWLIVGRGSWRGSSASQN